jgi:hypothetical protein
MLTLWRNGECRDDFRGLARLFRLDMQLRKTGKETVERRQVEDVSWGLLQCVEVFVERAV